MLHFTRWGEWKLAEAAGEYRPAAVSQDGFVRLSFGHQLARVATELAPAAADLVVLVVDPAGLEPYLRVEEGCPRLYRPIPVGSVRLMAPMPPREDGSFEVPEPARLAELALTSQPSAEAALTRVRSIMDGFRPPWWLAGGWAVDATAATSSRPHLDLDVAVLRRDMPSLRRHLAAWDVRLARDGQLLDWDGQSLSAADHQVWARPADGFRPGRWQDFAADPGFVEFLAEEQDAGGDWVFRRDPRVRAPLERLGRPGGFMAPEVALLYKAKAAVDDDPVVSAKSQLDFDRVLDHLEADQRRWLHTVLRGVHPGHPWLRALAV